MRTCMQVRSGYGEAESPAAPGDHCNFSIEFFHLKDLFIRPEIASLATFNPGSSFELPP
jgi:hypothetical protein